MKRMGIACCCLSTQAPLAVPWRAQPGPAAASPAAPSASASTPEVPPAIAEKLSHLEQKVGVAQRSADNA
jgi:hypothetical protein